MKITITFDPIIFEDLPPEEKSSDELIYLVLKLTRGDIVKIDKYSRNEIEKAARQLVINDFIRGTALDNDKCVWSKLTRKGERYLEILEFENFEVES